MYQSLFLSNESSLKKKKGEKSHSLIIHHFLCSFSTSRCTVFLALAYRVRKLMIFGWSIYFLFTEPSNDVHIDRSSHAVACLGLLRDGVNLSGDAHTRFVARASRFHR